MFFQIVRALCWTSLPLYNPSHCLIYRSLIYIGVYLVICIWISPTSFCSHSFSQIVRNLYSPHSTLSLGLASYPFPIWLAFLPFNLVDLAFFQASNYFLPGKSRGFCSPLYLFAHTSVTLNSMKWPFFLGKMLAIYDGLSIICYVYSE